MVEDSERVVSGDSEGVGQEGEGDSKPVTYVNTAADVCVHKPR